MLTVIFLRNAFFIIRESQGVSKSLLYLRPSSASVTINEESEVEVQGGNLRGRGAHSLLLIQSVVFTGVRWIAARTTRTGSSSEQNCHGTRQVSFIVNQRPDEKQAEHMKVNIKQEEPTYHHAGGNNLRRSWYNKSYLSSLAELGHHFSTKNRF